MVTASLGVWHNLQDLRSPLYQSVCYQSKHQATYLHLCGSRSHGEETRHFFVSMSRPDRLRLSPLHSSSSGLVESSSFDKALLGANCSLLVLTGLVHQSSCSPGGWASQAPFAVEPPCPAARLEVPSWPGGVPSSRLKVIKRLVRKAGFSRGVAEAIASNRRCSTPAVYQGKWSQFFHWCHGWNLSPCKAIFQQIMEFFLYLSNELKLLVPAVKDYGAALKHVFSLAGLDLAANCIICRMFQSFEQSRPPREVRPPDWNISLVLQSFTRVPYEPPKLSSDKYLTWKKCCTLAHTLAKRGSELHGLSFLVRLSRSWRSCTFCFFPDFVAKTQNPSVPDTTISSLGDFVGDDWDKLLLCLIGPLRSTWPIQISFVLMSLPCLSLFAGRRNGCPKTPLFSDWSIIHHAYASTFEQVFRTLQVRARKVWKAWTCSS